MFHKVYFTYFSKILGHIEYIALWEHAQLYTGRTQHLALSCACPLNK